MADEYNNKTGDPGPDGLSDDQAPNHIKVKMEENRNQAEMDAAAARARDMAMGNTGGSASPLALDPNALAAQVAVLDALNNDKVDDSFPVLVTGAREVQPEGVPDGIARPYIEQGVKVGLDTLTKEGFLGVTDQNIINKVVDLTGNKIEYSDTIYKAAVTQAAYNQKAGIPTSVEDILERWQKGGLPENIRKYINGGGSGSGGAFSNVNRVISLTDEGTARQVLNRALTQYLGREASDMENKMFLKALNVQEKQNPTTTTTKGYTDGSRNTTQSQTVEGGFSRDDFATRFARSQEGYAEYQAATTYLDAFINALESDSRVI